MSGGIIIIMRNAVKTALSDPLVHGTLSDKQKSAVDTILADDVNNWSSHDDETMRKAFELTYKNC